MSRREDTGPTVDPSRFCGLGEPYAGHWREFAASWPSLEQSSGPLILGVYFAMYSGTLLRSVRVKRAPRRSADVKSARVMLVARRLARHRLADAKSTRPAARYCDHAAAKSSWQCRS